MAWTFNEWFEQSTVPGTIYGDKSRSTELKRIDDAFKAYETAGINDKAAKLSDLWDAAEAWRSAKSDWRKSIRNKGTKTAENFFGWLAETEKLTMPVAEIGFSFATNCYAYSMKCKNPVVAEKGVVVPGAHAGEPRFSLQDEMGYYAQLVDGIKEDAIASNKQVECERGPFGNSLPSPKNPPIDKVGGEKYIAAMVVRLDGFHFLRRDSTTGLWSHKNGGGNAEIETGVYDTQRGRYVKLTDAVVVPMLELGQTRYFSGFNTFKFAAYLIVPHSGIRVAGAAPKK